MISPARATQPDGKLIWIAVGVGFVAVLAWEAFEFVIGLIGDLRDTLIDLMMDMMGAAAAGTLWRWLRSLVLPAKRFRTGTTIRKLFEHFGLRPEEAFVRFGMMALCLAGASSITACESGGVSTREVERAAVEHTRERLGLGQDVPLTAKVWVGREADGQMSYCGSVESESGATTRIPPQQFAAHGEPLSFFIFGDAHQIVPLSQPGMFENWTALCAGTQPA